jgi:predicted ATPase
MKSVKKKSVVRPVAKSSGAVPAYSFRWQNIKGIADSGWICLRPLTVFLGANGSGKSSSIAPLLLLRQTWESRDPAVALKTRGELFNGGSFRELVHAHDEKRNVIISVRFERATEKFKKSKNPPPHELELQFASAQGQTGDVLLSTYTVRDRHGKEMVVRQRQADGKFTIGGYIWEGKPSSSQLSSFIKEHSPTGFHFSPNRVLRKFLGSKEFENASKDFDFDAREGKYLAALGFVEQRMDELLGQFSYVGPLRERPRRFYELTGERPYSVGASGQFATELIFKRKDSEFQKSLLRWLEHFEFAEELKTTPLTDGVVQLLIRKSKGSPLINLADTGFGLSQVLPLIVQSLVTREGGLFVAEQPEIHLNPRLQTRLADLFADTAVSRNISVLLETHSEHLLLRLRTLLASKKLRAENVAIYFLEMVDGKSVPREIPIDEMGHIAASDWPKGFFEDGLNESFELARAQVKGRRT